MPRQATLNPIQPHCDPISETTSFSIRCIRQELQLGPNLLPNGIAHSLQGEPRPYVDSSGPLRIGSDFIAGGDQFHRLWNQE